MVPQDVSPLKALRNSLSSIPSGGIGLVLFLQKNYNLLSLGIGEPDFKTPDHIIEAAVESLRSGMTHYSPDEGLYALRLAILEKTQRNNGFGFDPDSQVVVTSGTSPAISGAIFVSVDPGDDVVIPTPTYLGYEPMVRLAGAHPVFVPSAEENGFIPTQDEISDAITSKTKMIIVSSPAIQQEQSGAKTL